MLGINGKQWNDIQWTDVEEFLNEIEESFFFEFKKDEVSGAKLIKEIAALANTYLFESAIDLLSYATLQKLEGKEWRREHLLSLAGVYQPAKEIEKSKVPAALVRTLKMHPEVKTIVLHLDNDRIGRLATKAISAVLPKQYQVKDVPPKQGKDYNDLLCIKLNLAITKREKSAKKSMSGHENMRDRR